jgi:hypothetical protein
MKTYELTLVSRFRESGVTKESLEVSQFPI